MTITLLKESYVTVLVEEEYKLVKFIWLETPKGDQYKKPFLALLDYVNEGNTIARFYSDAREQGVISPAYRKWFENEMLPAAIKAGLNRGAVVTNASVFKRYYFNMIISAINKFNMPIKLFGKEKEAMDFLLNGEV